MDTDTLLDHLEALIVWYMFEYVKENMEYALVDPDYASEYAALLERATRAKDGLRRYPELTDDIYKDFQGELKQFSKEIRSMFAQRKK